MFYSNCRDGKVNTLTNSKHQMQDVKPTAARAQRQAPLTALSATPAATEQPSDVTRLRPSSAISIQDVMKDVVIYVEVRSGEDNRSEGVRKVIETLGARINLSILK